MNEVLEYLKDCGTFYIATCEGSQPRVRPFGAVCAFEGKLYIVTNNQKKVYRQLKENGKVELCGMRDGTWIRVEGEVVEDLRREARVAMMDANAAGLSSLYTVDDNLMTCIPNLYSLGDGSGVTHSLSQASASGVYVARKLAAKYRA